jgi:hypothetical protein
MPKSTDDKAKRLRELRDKGAISDEDYRRMVLDLVDTEVDRPTIADEPSAAPSSAPIPPEGATIQPVGGKATGGGREDACPEVQEAPNHEESGHEVAPQEHVESEPKPKAPSAPDAQDAEEGHAGTSKAGRSARFAKRRKILIAIAAAAVIALAAVAYGFYSGDIAFKPDSVSQEYWDDGRRARAIGKDYLSGSITADEATVKLMGCIPASGSDEETDDTFVASAIEQLYSAIDQKGRADKRGAVSSDDGVKDTLQELDRALRGEK